LWPVAYFELTQGAPSVYSATEYIDHASTVAAHSTLNTPQHLATVLAWYTVNPLIGLAIDVRLNNVVEVNRVHRTAGTTQRRRGYLVLEYDPT